MRYLYEIALLYSAKKHSSKTTPILATHSKCQHSSTNFSNATAIVYIQSKLLSLEWICVYLMRTSGWDSLSLPVIAEAVKWLWPTFEISVNPSLHSRKIGPNILVLCSIKKKLMSSEFWNYARFVNASKMFVTWIVFFASNGLMQKIREGYEIGKWQIT